MDKKEVVRGKGIKAKELYTLGYLKEDRFYYSNEHPHSLPKAKAQKLIDKELKNGKSYIAVNNVTRARLLPKKRRKK